MTLERPFAVRASRHRHFAVLASAGLVATGLATSACGGSDAGDGDGAGGVGGSGGNGGSGGAANVCPRVDGVTIEPPEAEVGDSIALSALITDTDQVPAPASYAWTSTGGRLTNASSPSAIFTCTEATEVTITLDISDGDCGDRFSATVTCFPADVPPIKVNEVESSGGVPANWVELYNAGDAAVDLSGWVLRDSDDTHAYTVPAGTVIAAGAYWVVEDAALGFELDAVDALRVFDDAARLADAFEWTEHAAVTYGRCPDGSGAFVVTTRSTKGAANVCTPVEPISQPWPGQDDVQGVDAPLSFGTNLSGLTYEPATQTAPAVLWAVRNGPGTLYRLVFNGTTWAPDTLDGWGTGKALRYVDGAGNPDAEGVTKAEYASSAVFVATERNNDDSVSRLSVLRFDATAAGSSLMATMDWNLTPDLPATGANTGLEAITWIPDSYLIARGFFDESANRTYDAAAYPDHGSGLFFVGVEGSGVIHAYALNQVSGAFQRIASVASGQLAVMSLEFDRELGYLWVGCDATCGNELGILDIDTDPASATFGRFYLRRRIDRPSSLPNVNNEGIAFAPQSECVAGFRSFFWADDDATGGHFLRRDSIPCGPFLSSQ